LSANHYVGVQVKDENGGVEIFDKCIVSTRAPKALQMLGEEDSTAEERHILGAFKYSTRYQAFWIAEHGNSSSNFLFCLFKA
jgi:predicted NAD/FAD-binding protein